MAASWVRCAKKGHGPPMEGFDDSPQMRKDGRLFVSHVCASCGVIYINVLPLKSVSALMGPRGETLVSEGGEE